MNSPRLNLPLSITSGDTTSPPKLLRFCISHCLGFGTDLDVLVGDLQVWKIDGGVCFFGVVVGEETSVGECPSEDVMNYHDSDLIRFVSVVASRGLWGS